MLGFLLTLPVLQDTSLSTSSQASGPPRTRPPGHSSAASTAPAKTQRPAGQVQAQPPWTRCSPPALPPATRDNVDERPFQSGRNRIWSRDVSNPPSRDRTVRCRTPAPRPSSGGRVALGELRPVEAAPHQVSGHNSFLPVVRGRPRPRGVTAPRGAEQ